jgi:hypothetical protein
MAIVMLIYLKVHPKDAGLHIPEENDDIGKL